MIFGSPEFIDGFSRSHPSSKIFAVCPRVEELNVLVDRVLVWSTAKYCSGDDLKAAIGANRESFPRLSKKQIQSASNIEQIYLKMADRLGEFESYQWRKDLYLDHLEFWWGLIATSDFSVLIFENIPHECFDFVAYGVAKLEGKKTCGFFQLPIRPNEAYFLQLWTDIYDHGTVYRFSKERGLFDNLWKSKFQHYLSLADQSPTSITSFTRASDPSIHSSFKNVVLKIRKMFWAGDIFRRKRGVLIFRRMLRVFDLYDPYIPSMAFLKKDYEKWACEPKYDKGYIYFPLHYQPELTTSPLGGVFVDQLNVIKILSSVAVQLGLQVYVKEHPRSGKALGARSRWFYKQVANLPNTHLLKKNACSYTLIDNSVAVAIITGSSGFEASLRNRKVLMFGSRFYSEANNVFVVDSPASVLMALDVGSECSTRNCNLDKSNFFGFLSRSVCEGFINRNDSGIATVTRAQSVANQCALISFYIENGIFESDV
jgi:hypothetical protein